LGGAFGVLALVASAAQARPHIGIPYIQAHRGGSIVNGVPTYPENTMPAFRHSAAEGFVLELDAKLTKDAVPVVFHDASLDRVTDCKGRIDSRPLVELRSCRVDILGTEGDSVKLGRNDPRRTRIPSLKRVMALLRRTGATASIEIKNIPTDPDFDPTDAFATRVSKAIAASRVPQSQLIIQSFWPPNLDVAYQVLPDAELSLLTIAQLNDGGPAYAQSHGYEWVSPQWPVNPGYVEEAHSRGRQIVPFTLDAPRKLRAAADAGVDALITNDPLRARRDLTRDAPRAPKPPPPPSPRECRRTVAHRHVAPITSFDPQPGAPRVFAMQFKQELDNVTSYGTFRAKIECMIRRYVVPHLARHRPNVVAFNEDIGLMTLGTGSRGAVAREIFGNPEAAPSCEGQGAPCGAAAALAAVTAAYSPQIAAYQSAYPDMGPVAQTFVAATDTFARGWMQTFSDMARRYHVYIAGSNTQAPFRESRDPSEIATFSDPDLPEPKSVYVATGGEVYNEAFVWGPRDVRHEGPRPLRNVVLQNRKVPLTAFEEQLGFANGPESGPDARANLRPYRLPHTRARIGIATSLPAFQFGNEPDEPPPHVAHPCSDVTLYYMRCLDRLHTNLVLQDEANDGRWATLGGQGAWQPLEWMGSTWRTVADRTVRFKYNVTPFMVGNLADLPFDGQTAITQRGRARSRGCTFIGNRRLMPGPPENDPQRFRSYAGRKRQFLAIAPWVIPDASRDRLRATSARLAPGSHTKLENDYLETAVIADLPFPPDPQRPGCAG
jgi:glycerophosphoryl diester phosphodiesterase